MCKICYVYITFKKDTVQICRHKSLCSTTHNLEYLTNISMSLLTIQARYFHEYGLIFWTYLTLSRFWTICILNCFAICAILLHWPGELKRLRYSNPMMDRFLRSSAWISPSETFLVISSSIMIRFSIFKISLEAGKAPYLLILVGQPPEARKWVFAYLLGASLDPTSTKHIITSFVMSHGSLGRQSSTASDHVLCGMSCSNNNTSFSVSLSPIFPNFRTKCPCNMHEMKRIIVSEL